MDSSAPNNLIERFTSLTQQGFQTLLRKHKIALSVIFFATLFAGLFVAGLLEWVLYMPVWAKIAVVVLLVATAVGTLIYFYQQLDPPSFKTFYQQFGRKTDKTQLSNALDLYYSSDNTQHPLQQAAIRQNLQKLDSAAIKSQLQTFSQQHPIHKYYRAGLSGAAGALILLLAFTLMQPSAMNRLAHLWIPYAPPNPYSYTIEPGTVTLEQGESFSPQIRFDGDRPENLSLAFKTDIEEQYRQRTPINTEEQQARFSPIKLTTNGSYYFTMDGFESQRHRVNVQLRPRLEQLSVNVIPPAYTKLDTTSYTYPFSKIQAYKGSKLELTGITNKPVANFEMRQIQSVDTLQSTTSGPDSSVFNKQWTVTQTDTVSFAMADSAGLSNKNKFRFVVEPREDQEPFVSLITPSTNVKMKTPEPLQLEYEASDDFGITGASLRYELQRAFTDNPQQGSVSVPQPALNQSEQYTWQVPSLNPKPRDVLTFWVEVADNDGYNGAKIGRSQKLTITFPSMTEYMDEIENKESQVTQSLDSLSQSFDRMQQEYDQFKQQLKQDPETNWEQKQQLEEVEQERQKIDKQVEELNKKFEEIRKEIEQSQAMSPETMKSYEELQNLMKEINNPELQEALEKLRNSLGQMNPDQMKRALEDYEFNEEQYKQRIERTMELFKSLKLNSDLEKVAKSLEEMAEQEKQISESNQSPAQDLEQQQAIEKDLDNVQEQVEKLGDKAPKKSKQQVDQLQKETQQQMKQIKEQLQKNMEQLKKQQQSGGEPSPGTKQQQRKIQQQMQQTAQQMRSAKQQLNQQRMQVNMGALKYVLYSLINLSTNQEELTKETENLPTRTQAFVDKARKERNISSQFAMLSDSLFKVSSEIPGFSNKINKKKAEVEGQLSRAVNLLSERDKSNATFAQRQSLGGINELSSMVASLLEQLQNQQGGAGGSMSMQQLTQQLQQMSGQQQQLNQQIQQMINDIQGNRLSQDQMKRLNQMSRQQNRIRKQLKELQQKGQLESGDRVLSELQRMSEQMEDAINDIRGGQLDNSLMQRQKNILSRMLSAEKAVQERGKEDRREATTAQEQPDTVPPDVTLEELQQRVRKMLNDPNRTKFTEDYQRLIEEYFKLLKEQEKEVMQ